MSAEMIPIVAVDISELIWVGIFVVGGLISLFNQIATKRREQQEAAEKATRRVGAEDHAAPAAAKRATGRQPARGAGGAHPAKPQRPASLEDEIGDFLRRASQGRVREGRGARAQAEQARPAAGQPLPPRPAQAVAPVLVEVVEPAPRPVGGQVESRVAKDLDTRRFNERAQRLGQQTRQATARSGQVKQKKQKKLVAQATVEDTVPVSIPATSAAGFAVMLRDVDNVRQAIILNEILTRPVDRW